MSDTSMSAHDHGNCELCDQIERELAEVKAENAALKALLIRCRTVLGNMALENEGAIFNRWPISHEPLRADARNLIPLLDAAIDAAKNHPTGK
jgi:hypothetical protein